MRGLGGGAFLRPAQSGMSLLADLETGEKPVTQ